MDAAKRMLAKLQALAYRHWFVVIAITVLASTYGYRNWVTDDSYIYLRVAENIARDGKWAFNPTEVFNAVTSPIYAAALAITYEIIGSPIALNVLYAVSLILAGCILFIGLRSSGVGVALGSVVAILSWNDLSKSVGLEIGFMILFMAASALALDRQKPFWAGVASGALALVRPEGLAMLPLLLFAEKSRSPRAWLLLLLGWALAVAPWLAFSISAFGTISPHTAEIKHIQSTIPWWNWGPWGIIFLARAPLIPLCFIAAPFSIPVFVRQWKLEYRFPSIFVGFGLIQISAYSILSAPSAYFWYRVPGGVTVIVATIIGLAHLGRILKKVTASATSVLTRYGWRLGSGILATLAALTFVAHGYLLLQGFGKSYPLSEEKRTVGLWLNKNSKPGDVVAGTEIGYLGYYSDRKILDMLGLLDRAAIAPLKAGQWDWWLQENPEYIVIHDPAWIGEPYAAHYSWPAAALAAFSQSYHEVYRVGSIRLFRRVDLN